MEQGQVFNLCVDSFRAHVFVKVSAEGERSLASLKPFKISGSRLMDFAQCEGWSAREAVVIFIFFFIPFLVMPSLLDTPTVKGQGFLLHWSGEYAQHRSMTDHWTQLQTLQTWWWTNTLVLVINNNKSKIVMLKYYMYFNIKNSVTSDIFSCKTKHKSILKYLAKNLGLTWNQTEMLFTIPEKSNKLEYFQKFFEY